MKPLIILLSVFTMSLIVMKIFKGRFEFALSGSIALSAMLLFTAIGHFAFTKGMEMMLPSFIPFKTALVFLTGVIEIGAGVGIHISTLRNITGILLIGFFLLILPANIYASIMNIDYQNGTYNGNGLNYLRMRIPLQILFILWAYFFVIKKEKNIIYQVD